MGKKLLDYVAAEFFTAPAADQNAADLFEGDWTSRVPGLDTGGMGLFDAEDDRPGFVLKKFGSIMGWKILELGSFEGGHAYQLEKAGAQVIGIEANPYIFMRSLIVKNALSLNSKFLLGDFTAYLDRPETYDLIFCSGVLYHMPDPVGLIEKMSKRTDRIFIWTHYVDDENAAKWELVENGVSTYENGDLSSKYYRYEYPVEASFRAFAGTQPFASRMRGNDILRALTHFGYQRISIMKDEPNHPGGAAFSLIAER